MKYKCLYRENPQDKKIPGKYYPYPVYENTIDTNDFVAEISHATSLTPTDVRSEFLMSVSEPASETD